MHLEFYYKFEYFWLRKYRFSICGTLQSCCVRTQCGRDGDACSVDGDIEDDSEDEDQEGEEVEDEAHLPTGPLLQDKRGNSL